MKHHILIHSNKLNSNISKPSHKGISIIVKMKSLQKGQLR